MSTMEHFTLRLPSEAVSELEEMSKQAYIPLRTMVRAWIMQRLREEKQAREDEMKELGVEDGD